MIPVLEAIKRILRFDWDPIGVGEISPDEYDGYAMHLFTILHQDAAEQDVETYLNWAEVEHMGLSQPSGLTADVARKVVQAHRNKGQFH